MKKSVLLTDKDFKKDPRCKLVAAIFGCPVKDESGQVIGYRIPCPPGTKKAETSCT